MKLVIRNTDNYVLNSVDLPVNGNDFTTFEEIPVETIFEGEDYYVLDSNTNLPVPNEFDANWQVLHYYYDGVTNHFSMKCLPKEYELMKEIQKVETELSSTDYIIVKQSEATLLNREPDPQYNMEDIALQRQLLRDRINELRSYLTEKFYD